MMITVRVHSADPTKLTEGKMIDGVLEHVDRSVIDVELVHDEHNRHGTIRLRLAGKDLSAHGALFERDGLVDVTFTKHVEAIKAA